MNFIILIRAGWDRETERAYVELRARDDDGGESIVTAIFSYRTTSRISKHELKQDNRPVTCLSGLPSLCRRVLCPTYQSRWTVTTSSWQSPVLGCQSPIGDKVASSKLSSPCGAIQAPRN